MVLGLDLVGSIIVSSLVLAISYFLNGYRQRQLEKRTTNYHTKLSAFQKVNEAAVGLIGGLIGLRNLLSTSWEDSPSEEQIFEVAWLMALAREAERPLGTSIAESLSEDLKKATLAEDDEIRKKALGEWAEATYVSLIVLYTRVLAFHIDDLTLQASQADIVSDNDDVESALAGFQERAMEYLGYLADRTGKGTPTVEELANEIAVLDKEWRRLKVAMWAELDATL
jgi:hypothetical protein